MGAFFALCAKNRAIRSNSSKIALRQFSAGFPLLSLAQRPITPQPIIRAGIKKGRRLAPHTF
jgi:hypothetical protein